MDLELSTSRHEYIQEDWENREYIETITSSIRKMSDFLNTFDTSCRYRLSKLNEKLSALERKIEYIEARVDSANSGGQAKS